MGTVSDSSITLETANVLVVTGEDLTADAVICALNERGVPVCRFDLADLQSGLVLAAEFGRGGVSGTLRTPSRSVDLADVRALYYRRPHAARYLHLPEAERRFAMAEARAGLGGVLEALPRCHYVSHPRRIAAAEAKPLQLSVAAGLGFAVPPTLITTDPGRAASFVRKHHPVVYKALTDTGFDDGTRQLAAWVREVEPDEIDETIAICPHMFQRKVDKRADVRLTMVGDQAFAVRIDSPLTDWRERYDLVTGYRPVDPPSGLVEQCTAFLNRLGLEFGCFNFGMDRVDPCLWWFYECNAAGEWGWIEGQTGLPIAAAFADLLQKGLP